MNTALTLVGNDSSGGAGIQSNIRIMLSSRICARSIRSFPCAQNTTGVSDIIMITPEYFTDQFDCIFANIRPDAFQIIN